MVDWRCVKEAIESRMPLIYVFLSGIGFSIQTLMIKILKEQGFQGSFQCVFMRGWIQLFLSVIFIYYDADRIAGKGRSLFGDTNYVRWIMFIRSFIGYGGIAFSFLAVELIPMGDSTVLVMLSPLVASVAGYFILGEPWRVPEFVATAVSLAGATLVARPSFIFGDTSDGSTTDAAAADTATGVIYSLIAALSAGLAYVCVRMLGTVAKMPWPNVCFAQSLCQIGLAVPSLYLAGQHITFDLTAMQYTLIVLVGFVGAWSQIAMTVGMQREKSALATGMRMSDVVFGFIWQALFTADAVSALSVVGAVLVTSSIIILVVFKQQTPPPAPVPVVEDDDGDALSIEMTGRNPLQQLHGGDSESNTDDVDSQKQRQMAVSGGEGGDKDSLGESGRLQKARRTVARLITATLRRGGRTSNSNGGTSGGGGGAEYSSLAQQGDEEEGDYSLALQQLEEAVEDS